MTLINYLTVLVLGITLFIIIRRNEKASPLTAFCTIWMVVVFLYSLRLYNINSIGNNTAWILFLGISSFCFGYLIMNRIKIKDTKRNYSFNWRFVRILCAMTILVSMPHYLASISTMVRGGIASAAYKMMLVTGEADSGGIWMQFFVRPLEFIFIGLSGYVFTNRIKERFIFVSGIYFCTIKFISTGSKSAIVFYALIFVFSGIYKLEKQNEALAEFHNKQKHVPMKWKVVFATLVAAFLITMNAVSDNIFKSLYFYLAGCIPLFDKVINTNFYFNGSYTHGWVSFNGLLRFFINILESIGINLDTSAFDRAYSTIVQFEYTNTVAPGVKYNAFTTYLSAFYIDYGVTGVIIMSLLFGMISCYIYRRFKMEQTPARFSQLVIVYYMVVFSIVRFQLSNTVIAMAFIYASIICMIGNSKFRLVVNSMSKS